MGSAPAFAGSSILKKYQGVAPNHVIKAVQKASARTGVDFAFLMEKASAESSFNPAAKSRSSSATGLYQFISDTWLTMVKRHGEKFGLGEYAEKIEIRNGRACVDDCKLREEILNLRNNPEISALMAGAFTADNKAYLQNHTRGEVGGTEMYLAHFMGAGSAAKFLNCRAANGDAIAAKLFPNAARANKSVFYNPKTRQPRTLDEIYNIFANKFSGGKSAAPAASPPEPALAAAAPRKAPAVPAIISTLKHTLSSLTGAQALPAFDDDNEKDDIIWSDDPRFRRREPLIKATDRAAAAGGQKLSPASILFMAQEGQNAALYSRRDRHGYNS